MTTRQKFNKPTPRLKRLESAFAGIPSGAQLYISSPAELDELIRQVREGETQTVSDLRNQLATAHTADATCPVTTAMYLRTVVELALENLIDGIPLDEITPFWRVIDSDSPIARRAPGASDLIAAQRAIEVLPAPPHAKARRTTSHTTHPSVSNG